jgi:hypothetical protein
MTSLNELCISKLVSSISKLPPEIKEKVLGISIRELKKDLVEELQMVELKKYIFTSQNIFEEMLEDEINKLIYNKYKTLNSQVYIDDGIKPDIVNYTRYQVDKTINLLLEKNILQNNIFNNSTFYNNYKYNYDYCSESDTD